MHHTAIDKPRIVHIWYTHDTILAEDEPGAAYVETAHVHRRVLPTPTPSLELKFKEARCARSNGTNPHSYTRLDLDAILTGASSVGKSSLLLRFTDETFLSPDETSATIGVDFKVKVIERKNKRWKLSIWDTAGQERFRTLTSSYYRGAQGVILVYDITARDTFESLTSWIAELDTFAGTGSGAKEVRPLLSRSSIHAFFTADCPSFENTPQVVRMIVGNKTDREFSRVVSTAEGEAFAQAQNPPWLFMECSAKKGGEDVTGEDGLFSRVVDKIVETPSLYMKNNIGVNSINKKGPPGQFPSGTVNLDEAEESGGGWCAC
ncbi:BZ3500_MvSof-1268-A1-R1_Chr1-3g01948 [Microbotryum saponariae]|uniref:BZ3500_MvSof-1268-A1-R1_Chr1-3g01948 protein n=1 Tax=Microbotryum saponariae TaxID=289078 RepID=A0A2X0KVQ2_9BASI|nr:BZ3500_MvSof-1268-A1-R1_Chr1-3g01948 [Microbotryum saponariae]SCZ94979.1 BZ3501_MvSof-1269-A2-R1_Chr1-3g01550 [Microbotryum saponariae]